MELGIFIPSKVSQKKAGKYYITSHTHTHTHTWNLKYDTNALLRNRNSLSDMETDLWLPRGSGWETDGVGVSVRGYKQNR